MNALLDESEVIETLLTCKFSKKIVSYYFEDNISLPKDVLHYNFEMLTLENKLCYFLYLYLSYC